MNLFELVKKTYLELGQLTVATATGGSTSTLVDSALAGTGEDNSYKGSALLLIKDAAGANAAPEGEWSVCTAYTDSSGTFATVWTVAPASGDTYGMALETFPLFTMIELVNQGLESIGDIPLPDTSITTSTGDRDYALPIACKRKRPLSVRIRTDTDSGDYSAEVINDWDILPAAPGSTGTLHLYRYPEDGKTIEVWYQGIHPKVSTTTGYIAESIEPRLAVVASALAAAKWYNRLTNGSETFWMQTEDRLQAEYQNLMVQKSIQFPTNEPNLFIVDPAEGE
jgi:hypothetical protein